MATHQYILSAGHMNSDRGGAQGEIGWTYPMCRKVKAAIERRGGRAWIIQDEDGDGVPGDSPNRGLQAVARLCVSLADAVGGVDAYISMHYEGAGAAVRGFFGIHPDGYNDTKAMNPLDVRMIENIADATKKRTGMPLRRLWGHNRAGVMSEKETGVGAKGYRLGEFVGTMGFRTRTARTVLEFGNRWNPADHAMQYDPAKQDAYAEAIVDGLEATFGKFEGGEVVTPSHQLAKGDKAKATERLNVRVGVGLKYDVATTLDVGDEVEVIADDAGRSLAWADGYTWVNVEGSFGTGWTAINWLEKVEYPDSPPAHATFTTRYELPFRESPGFNGKITADMPEGTKGDILEGPEMHDGIGWYLIHTEEFGEGYAPASILRTLDIEGEDVATADVDD